MLWKIERNTSTNEYNEKRESIRLKFQIIPKTHLLYRVYIYFIIHVLPSQTFDLASEINTEEKVNK